MESVLNFIENLARIKIRFFSSVGLYLDLGTSNTRIAIKDKGIVLREATVLGLNKKTKEYIFFGQEAKSIIGKVPEFIEIDRPIINATISHFDAAVALLHSFIQKALAPYASKYALIKPGFAVTVAVPHAATEIEQKAVEEALLKVGATRVNLVQKPLASAIGCGFNIFAHKPVFIVDMGGGLIEMTIISGGGIVLQRSLKNAGEHMNKLIYDYIYLKHGLLLGELTCEELKMKLLNFSDDEKTLMVRGKSLETSLPKSVKIKTSDIQEALLSNINHIIDTIREMIERSPPEVVDEIFDHGITLVGGLANIPGIHTFFSNELKIKLIPSEKPDSATITGLIKIGRRGELLDRLRLSIP